MAVKQRSVWDEAHQLLRAMKLVQLGARLQVLEREFPMLCRDRLNRLYREVTGASPPKGMLPFSADWYLTWAPNAHASLFANIYAFLETSSPELDRVDLLSRAYPLYVEHFHGLRDTPLMDLTRAWTLLRFQAAGVLKLTPCTRCTGRYITHEHDNTHDFVCGLCAPPSRAGKTRAAKQALLENTVADEPALTS
jgi:flagellar transcriptional activator FlhC